MSSVVYYKFLHQKNRSVIHFDGTSINVFDLKREIILQNQLGVGNDFNLKLYHSEQPDLEYELDQDVIPRSSFILAKRSPVKGNARFGTASRYVSGKPRVNKKLITGSNVTHLPIRSDKPVDENISEEDKIKLMFENQSNAWEQTQDELSTHKLIYNKPGINGIAKQEDAPPPGYICYRCGKKDHWIKNCPTNTDPNFEGKKILRTTGIPKLYLKTISKLELEKTMGELGGASTNENGDMVDKDGNAILVTEDGDYAIALADSKTWINYQQKQNAALQAQREFELKILECMMTENKLQFVDPLSNPKGILKAPIVMTPCCTSLTQLRKLTNYCYNRDALESLLIENDFHCPNCNTEDVYIDTLISNEQIEKDLKEYIETKTKELGIEDPSSGSKRFAEDGEGEPDFKKQRVGLPLKPGYPLMFMPPMPMPPMPIMNGMFMPPFPPKQ